MSIRVEPDEDKYEGIDEKQIQNLARKITETSSVHSEQQAAPEQYEAEQRAENEGGVGWQQS